jgi:predicted RNA-binding protein YlxR (DUF448 family)
MVDGDGLLLGRGVWIMKELEQFLNVEAEFVFDGLMRLEASNTDRAYYQGRIDQLAQVRRYLQLPQLMIEREKADNV